MNKMPLLTLHVKLDLMKNFMRAMDKKGAVYHQLGTMFLVPCSAKSRSSSSDLRSEKF